MSDHTTNASSAAEKPEQATKPELSLGAIVAQSKAAADERRRQRQARQSKTGGKKRGLPQTEENDAVGEQSSAALSTKRPRIGAFLPKSYSGSMDRVGIAGFVSSTGSSSTAEGFAAAMNNILEQNIRSNNGEFQKVQWNVKVVTKQDRELAHRIYMQRSLPLEVQYEQEQERRGGIKQGPGRTAQPATGGATAAYTATPAGTEGGEKPVVYKTGVDRKGMDRNDLDAEMDVWRKENNIGEDDK